MTQLPKMKKQPPTMLHSGKFTSESNRNDHRVYIWTPFTISQRRDKWGRWHAWCDQVPAWRATSEPGMSSLHSREAVKNKIDGVLNATVWCKSRELLKEAGRDPELVWGINAGARMSKSNQHKYDQGKECHWPNGQKWRKE